MRQPFALSENILQSLYATNDILPQTWEVIYQEGIRRNHLLFPADRVAQWADGMDLGRDDAMEGLEDETLAETVMSLLSCPRLSDMQALIRQLDERLMRFLFLLYMHALGWWRVHLRSSVLH